MKKNNIVNMNDWLVNHELLFGIGILGNDYLELTAKNAMEARGMQLTREDVYEFQEYNGLIDTYTNNAGVIDVNTFVYLIDIFHEDEKLMNDILAELNKSIDLYLKTCKSSTLTSLIQRVKNFLGKFQHKNNKS